jgi:hypothetical protein
MTYKTKVEELLEAVLAMAKAEVKRSGFCIGNTSKIEASGLYLTPIRNTSRMVFAGVIVYSERQAIEIAKIVDAKVDYILVDAEKKTPDSMSLSGDPANVERSVRETIKHSKLWIYKGNDLSVEAIDNFITHVTRDPLRGVGGKKVTILGAGNLGCKLALKMVERGAHVFITRRDPDKLEAITKALNYIKPAYTRAEVVGLTDNREASNKADILIGMAPGTAVITPEIIENLAVGALVIDGGKGTVSQEALKTAEELAIEVYRLDVSAAFEGMISSNFATEHIVRECMGRKLFKGEFIVAGGLLGRKGDVVVDSVNNPKIIYGIADGRGDFIRSDLGEHSLKIEKLTNKTQA